MLYFFRAKNAIVKIIMRSLNVNKSSTMSNTQKSAILEEFLHHIHRLLGSWISRLATSSSSSEASEKTLFSILALVNDVSDLNKALTGSFSISVAPVDVGAMGQQALAIFEEEASPRISLHCVLDLQTEKVPYLDYSRCLQVVVHMLRNALRHTHEGAVTLKVVRETGEMFRFSVQDTGRGIAPSKQKSVLSAFNGDCEVGEHLGLGLCGRIAHLLRGTMGMSSVDGVGSVFWFTCLDFASISSLDPASDLKS